MILRVNTYISEFIKNYAFNISSLVTIKYQKDVFTASYKYQYMKYKNKKVSQ